MGKKLAVVLVGLCAVVALSGCVMPQGSVLASVSQTKSPVAMGDSSVRPAKVGTAEVEGILFLAFGDNSIKKAAENGNITRIHHVESEELNVLGSYCRSITQVYGE